MLDLGPSDCLVGQAPLQALLGSYPELRWALKSSLIELFISYLRTSYASAVLQLSGLTVAELLGSSEDTLLWLLLCFCAGLRASGVGKIIIRGANIRSCFCWVGVLFLGFCCPF